MVASIQIITNLCFLRYKFDTKYQPSGRVKHLVMDGVYVGHHKKYAHMIRNPKYIFRPNYILPNTATGNDRLITNTSIRLLMIRFSIQHLGTIRADWVC